MRMGLTDMMLIGAGIYAVYAWAYKGQTVDETTSDLTQVSSAVARTIARAPEALYDAARGIPQYEAWSDSWIEEKLNRNGNRPS